MNTGTDNGTDFVATELLKELKESNARKDAFIAQSTKQHTYERIGWMLTVVLIVVGFLLYLNQYDFLSSEEYNFEATGVYALIDSEGNVIAQDLTPDEMTKIMEVLDTYGESESVGEENPAEG